MNTKAPEVDAENTLENPDRRDFMARLGALAATTAVATATLAEQALAEEVTPVVAETEIPYIESKLGIDYRAIADAPVDAMLSQGEAEWIANATPVFEDETVEAWKDYMAPEIGMGGVSDATIETMKEFTPNMLLSFAKIDPNHEKFALLAAVGLNFQLEQHINGST